MVATGVKAPHQVGFMRDLFHSTTSPAKLRKTTGLILLCASSIETISETGSAYADSDRPGRKIAGRAECGVAQLSARNSCEIRHSNSTHGAGAIHHPAPIVRPNHCSRPGSL